MVKGPLLFMTICTSCADLNEWAVHDLLRRYLWQHVGMSLHAGKTKVWNRSGACSSCEVFGVPLGHPDFVLKFLEAKCSVRTDSLGSRLLLSFCAAARANFCFGQSALISLTDQFAAAHDDGVWECLCRTLKISPTCGAWEQSSLLLWEGGLGLRSAARTQLAAHWASSTNALKMVQERHPGLAEIIVGAFEANSESPNPGSSEV